MGRDMKPGQTKRCYACMNWEGNRTIYAADKKIKTDDRDQANCLYWHLKKSGSDSCKEHNPIM